MTPEPTQPKVDIDTSEPIVPFPPGMTPASQQSLKPENLHLCVAEMPPEGQSPQPLMQCQYSPDIAPDIHTCRYDV